MAVIGYETLTILNGPGKFDLMLALFERKEVLFSLAPHGNTQVVLQKWARITSIESEGGDDWKLNGFIMERGKLGASISQARYTTRGNGGSMPIYGTLE